MKKIISLVLAIIMTAGLLVSCGYSFAEDDMSNYATFDVEAFKTLLKDIKIEDADFTADDAVREKKHLDTIYEALTANAVAKTEGKLADYDMLKYCFYITCDLDKEGEEGYGTIEYDEIFSMDKMKGASPSELQMGLKDDDADSLAAKLYALVKDFEFKPTTETGEGDDKTTVPGNNYETVTKETKSKAGDVVVVTYTSTYFAKNGDTVADKETKQTLTTVIMTLGEDALSKKLIDQTAGATVADFTLTDAETGLTTKDGVHYTGVKLDWIITAGYENEITVEHKYTSATTLKPVDGSEAKSLKDKTVTYHVFPTGYEDTPDLDTDAEAWTLIMVDIFGTNVTSSYLDVFADEKYKNSDGVTLKQLIDGDSDKDLTALANLIYNKQSATATTDQAAKDEGKKTASELLDERVAMIKALVDANDGLNAQIVKEYKEFVYENLVNQYNNQIRTNIAAEIKKIIEDSVTINSRPEKAVDEVYDILMQNHEYTFHTGSSTVDGKKVTYYTQHGGSFDKYLISALTEDGKGPANIDEAEAQVRATAEDFVDDLVRIYIVSEAYGVVISDKEYKDMTYDDPNYTYNVSSYGDIGVRSAYQFEKLYAKLLIIEGEQEAIDDYNAKVEAGDEDAEYDFDIVYKEGKIDFVNVEYTIKEAETE